jgi:hypothetical protein
MHGLLLADKPPNVLVNTILMASVPSFSYLMYTHNIIGVDIRYSRASTISTKILK